MVDFITRNPYSEGYNAGVERARGRRAAATQQEIADLQRIEAESGHQNKIALDRNIRSGLRSAAMPTENAGSGPSSPPIMPRPTTPGVSVAPPMMEAPPTAAAPVPASVQAVPREPQQGATPVSGLRNTVSDAYLRTPGHAAEGAKMAIEAASEDDARSIKVFDATIGYLKAGRADLAQMYAKRFGMEIPFAVLKDTRLQQGMTQLWTYYKEIYGDNPNKLKDAMRVGVQSFLKTASEAKQQSAMSQPQPQQDNPFDHAGLPTPSATKKTPTASEQGVQVRMAQWLIDNKVANNPREAWSLVTTVKHDPSKRADLIVRIFTALNNDPLDRTPIEQKKQKAIEFVDSLMAEEQTTTAAPSAGAQTPAAPAAPAGDFDYDYVPGRGAVPPG